MITMEITVRPILAPTISATPNLRPLPSVWLALKRPPSVQMSWMQRNSRQSNPGRAWVLVGLVGVGEGGRFGGGVGIDSRGRSNGLDGHSTETHQNG